MPNLLLFCQLPLPIIKFYKITQIITIRITIITQIVFSTAITTIKVSVVHIRLKIICIIVIIACIINCCNCNLLARRSCRLVRIKWTVLYPIALISTSYAFASLSVLIADCRGSRTSTLKRSRTRSRSGGCTTTQQRGQSA